MNKFWNEFLDTWLFWGLVVVLMLATGVLWWPYGLLAILSCAGIGVLVALLVGTAMHAPAAEERRDDCPCSGSRRQGDGPAPTVMAGVCMDCNTIYRAGSFPASHGLCGQCAEKRNREIRARWNLEEKQAVKNN
jgi:hypothetical protein